MSERPYDDISVQDVLDRADVGRSTFYDHFSGKDDLLRYGFTTLTDELADFSLSARKDEPFGFSVVLFRHAMAHEVVYRSMMGGRGAVVARREFRRVLDQQIAAALSGSEPETRGWLVAALSGTFLGLLEYWLDGRRTATAEELDSAFRRVISGVL